MERGGPTPLRGKPCSQGKKVVGGRRAFAGKKTRNGFFLLWKRGKSGEVGGKSVNLGGEKGEGSGMPREKRCS